MVVTQTQLEKLVADCLSDFYTARINKLKELSLRKTLSNKNPYLFRAVGLERADDIIDYLLSSFMSSSDETTFGNSFFEPLAKAVSIGGAVSPSTGVDIAIETDKVYSAYAVKSGPKWGNADAKTQQRRNFAALQARLTKIKKQFDPVIGHGYGVLNRPFSAEVGWRDISGQAFWSEISADPDLYLKIIDLIKKGVQAHRTQFQAEWAKIVNTFTQEFIDNFCNSDGSINWETLTKFVSEESKATRKALQKQSRKPRNQ